MIYKASEVIYIFGAGERTDERTKVFQEVLADLKRGTKEENEDLNMKKWSKNTNF